mgnify:CR=1 FL=1
MPALLELDHVGLRITHSPERSSALTNQFSVQEGEFVSLVGPADAEKVRFSGL